jgi:hypothetical protein
MLTSCSLNKQLTQLQNNQAKQTEALEALQAKLDKQDDRWSHRLAYMACLPIITLSCIGICATVVYVGVQMQLFMNGIQNASHMTMADFISLQGNYGGHHVYVADDPAAQLVQQHFPWPNVEFNNVEENLLGQDQ